MKNINSMTAGFWKRMLAFIFDIMIINIIIIWPFQKIFSNYVMPGNISSNILNTPQLSTSMYFVIFIIFFLAMLYFIFFEYYLGQSIGQMFFDIKIISKNDNITLWRAFLRNCFMLPIFPFYILWVIEPLYLAFYKERLTERLTGTSTVVVSKSRGYLSDYKLQKV